MTKKNKLEIEVSNGYDWQKGGKKFAINTAIVVLTGLTVLWQDDPRYIALIPLVKLGLNYLKHK